MADVRRLTPAETAACLMAILERRGAVFVLRDDGTFHCDLDRSDIQTRDEADTFAAVVLMLRDEIRALLEGQQITH